MSKLTRTEEMAAELYFEQGLKPKEIASKLGISVNTVYKAISKYRNHRRNNVDHEDNSTNDQQTYVVKLTFTVGGVNYSSPINDYREFMEEVKALKEMLVELTNELRRSRIQCMSSDAAQRDEAAPDFIRENVWVDVIRSRYSSIH